MYGKWSADVCGDNTAVAAVTCSTAGRSQIMTDGRGYC